MLSTEQLKEVLEHGRILAVSDGQEFAETNPSPPGTSPVLSQGALAAISSSLRTKMTAVGLLRA